MIDKGSRGYDSPVAVAQHIDPTTGETFSVVTRGTRGRERQRVADARRARRERDRALAEAARQRRDAIGLQAVDLAQQMTAGELDVLGFYVYLLFDATHDEPFYVGQSTNLLGRLGSHYSTYGERIRKVKLIHCPDREAMDATERTLIRHYRPAMNIRGVRSPRSRTPKD